MVTECIMMNHRFDIESHNPLHDSHLYGVGIKFRVESGHAKITKLQPGSSASLTGMLHVGDVIVSINNRELSGDYCEQVTQKYMNGRLHQIQICLMLSGPSRDVITR